MYSRYILLTVCAALPMFGAELQPADPFASYHDTLEKRVSAMVENQNLRSLPAIHESPSGNDAVAPAQPKQNEINFFARRYWHGRESDLLGALDRLRQLRPAIEPILDQEGVPKNLLAVVLVESGAQQLAASPRQARGLWQFIPETARRYGLTVSLERDDRIQVEAATRAAARYLRDLHSRFGNWPLALAAYNAGENAVQALLKRSKATTFSEVSSAGLLPPETQSYVPAVLSAMQLLAPSGPDGDHAPAAERQKWVYASAIAGN